MDVRMMILGLLSIEPASGYDLKKHFESTVDHFFHTGFGSIYPALAALAEADLVECKTVEQDGRPDRKVYQITAAGEQALRTQLATCEPTHRVRSELLALFYFAHLMPPQRVSALLDQRIANMEASIHAMSYSACPAEHRWPASVRFVQGFGIALQQAAVDYMREHRGLLENSDAPASTAAKTRTRPKLKSGRKVA